ncbi:MAG: porin family protein [Pseudomonadales bacterium]|jgi:hypothetical protein|nr:porin family protein [Pseudomonadales bacterium]
MRKAFMIATCSLLASGALAAEPGFYIGGGAGLWTLDEGGFDDSALAIRGIGGYRFSDYLSVEGAALYGSELEDSGLDLDVTGLELTLRPSIPLSPDFELYGRAGWGWYDAQASFAGFDVDGQEDEFVWGFGGAWTPERSPFSLFIEYTQPDFDVDTSFVTLGVTLSL